jgi:hypothetical protein
MSPSKPLTTPDGRYIVVRGRLWRCTNPDLPEVERQHWVQRLMGARRSVAQAKRERDAELERKARDQVDEAKRALGERGPVWWQDGAPDYTQYKVENTPYADWYAALERT